MRLCCKVGAMSEFACATAGEFIRKLTDDKYRIA